MSEWINSIYSDGSSAFVSNPLPSKGEKIKISVRCKNNEKLKHVMLRCKINGAEQLHKMEKEKSENGLDYFCYEMTIWEKELHYQFYFVTDKKIFYYTQYRITDYLPDESYDFRILADYKQPKWVKNSVFYQIFPDRFCNGNVGCNVVDGEYEFMGYPVHNIKAWKKEPEVYAKSHGLDFYGGDLYGIKEKIPYLKELGVTALYINPIFKAATVHRYDCVDYFEIDERVGGNQALEELSNALHENGMKFILDISINHTGNAAKWFNKEEVFYEKGTGAFQDKNAPEREYYFLHEDNSYDSWFGNESLPVLDYSSKELCKIIYQAKDSVIKKWLKPPYSIDGWRFDVADVMCRNNLIQLSDEIWPQIRNSIKEENKEAYVLAEDWSDCREHLMGDEWDATMNYFGCARPVREFVGEVDLFQQRKEEIRNMQLRLDAGQFKNRIIQFFGQLPFVIQQVQFNLIDSHDVVRLHNNPNISFTDYKSAVILYFTLPGTPCIYYGDENGLNGRTEDIEGCRYPMDWELAEGRNKFYQLYHSLAELRKKSQALCEGGLQFISSDGYVLAFARCMDTKVLFVIVSMSIHVEQVNLPYTNWGISENAKVQSIWKEKVDWEKQGEDMIIKVPPHTSYVLEVK